MSLRVGGLEGLRVGGLEGLRVGGVKTENLTRVNQVFEIYIFV